MEQARVSLVRTGRGAAEQGHAQAQNNRVRVVLLYVQYPVQSPEPQSPEHQSMDTFKYLTYCVYFEYICVLY